MNLRRLARFGLVLAGAQALVGIVVAAAPGSEGPAGGVLYAALYAAPALLIALALRSTRPWLRSAGGWVALLLALYYSAVPIGNWAGYSPGQAAFVVAITTPTVLFHLAAFWMAAIRRAAGPAGTAS